jgi:soluble lytic murein transglycosylase
MTPGAVGPQTKYGRAIGLSQMLPATAQEMAGKLGLPWRPDLLSGKDEASAAYQARLGAAYLQEGLQRTGNVRDALRYYHGGPNRALWGPKTNAYADQVLSRLRGM